ncbi:MAG: Bax inhibitor-1/YccA family protein [Candidatus Gastranaerophilaceae bacterium]
MANPVLGEKTFTPSLDLENNVPMTINGTILKTCFLGLLTAVTFIYNWGLILSGFSDKATMLSQVGIFGGLGLVLFICFAPKNKFLMITTSLYALCEGLVLGYMSAIANKFYPGVASQAAMGTILALFGMFFLYKTGVVKPTEKFKMIIFNSTFAIFLIYVAQMILGFFHITIPGIFSNSPIGIAFSVIVVAIASLNLILDFDLIASFAGRVEKHFEWYCGFSLLVTIIWMYIEILRLLMKLQSRNS